MIAAVEAIAAFLLFCTAGFFVCIALARPGWQDRNGFHEGEPPLGDGFDNPDNWSK